MGLAQAVESRITGEELAGMGDIGPCELIEGRIAPMSPTGKKHSIVEQNFSREVGNFVYREKIGKVLIGETGIYTWRNPDTVRGADLLYISNERYAKSESPSFLDVAPELIVEIMSPDDRWTDVMEKLQEYFGIGVCLVWIADPKSRRVHAYRSLSKVQVFSPEEDLKAEDILPGFSVKVGRLFED